MKRENPFPGVNPWMQTVWHDVHVSLITYIKDEIADQLPDDLMARAEENITLVGTEEKLIITKPDVSLTESESWKSGRTSTWSPNADNSLADRVATPVIVEIDQETHRWIEISDSKGNLITVIEILSPANKTKAGRIVFEKKLDEFWSRGVSTIEIDLIRGEINADAVRLGINWPTESQQIIVTRRGNSSHHEVYPCPIRESLPVFRIPLREAEPDLLFDLQPLIDRCYAKGRYWMLDYEKDPSPAVKKTDLKWAREILNKEKG